MPPAPRSQYRQPGDQEPLTPEKIYEDLRAMGVPHEIASRQAGIPGFGPPPPAPPAPQPAPAAGRAARPTMGMMPGAGDAAESRPAPRAARPSPAPGYPSGRPGDGLGRIEPNRNAQYEQVLDFPRRWASADQRFTLEGGQLVGIHFNGQVDILRPDGRTVHPHVSELSPEDQQHIYKKRESFADFRAENIEREPAPPRPADGWPGVGEWRPTVPDTRRARARQAREEGRKPMPGRGQALPRRGDLLAAEADMDQIAAGNGAEINNLEGADPARQPAPRAARPQGTGGRTGGSGASGSWSPAPLPAGFVPVSVRPRQDEQRRYQPFRGRGEMYPEPGSMDRTPKMLETESPLTMNGEVVGVDMEGNVLIDSPDGQRSRIHLSQLSGRDAAHILSSLPSELTGRVSLANPEDLRQARDERERYMWEEQTGFVGDGRDLADTEAKLAEFRRQRRAGMRPGTNTEQQFEMFGPPGDDAAARAEAQAGIDAQVAAGQRRDKAVRQSIDREKAKYGPGRGVVRYDSEGNRIPVAKLTPEQKQSRSERRARETREKLDPTRERVIINNLARRAGISVEEARQIYNDGRKVAMAEEQTDPLAIREAGLNPLRDRAATARNAQLNRQQEALRSRNMLAGNDPRANLTNAFGTMDKEWQDYVMARLLGADPGDSPADRANKEREFELKERQVRADEERNAAMIAQSGSVADRQKEKDAREAAQRAEEETMNNVSNTISGYPSLALPSNEATKNRLMLGLREMVTKGRDPENIPDVDQYLIKGVRGIAYKGLFDREFDAAEEQEAEDMLRRLGVPNPMRYIERARRSRSPSPPPGPRPFGVG